MDKALTLRTVFAACCLLGVTADTPAAAPANSHDLVVVSTFAIDRHEVTIGQFRAFTEATALVTQAEREGGGRQYRNGWEKMPGWTWRTPYGRPASDEQPVAHVTFDEAKAYCAWAGLRLPKDSEWVEAAYTERRANPPAPFAPGVTYPYPTGATATGANGTHETTLPVPHDAGVARDIRQGRGAVNVRTSAQGVNGLYDMGGNVWEWVDHDTAGQKRTRGGSWWYGAPQMRADAIYDKPPDFPAVYIGFRCASDKPRN
ncbi:MAG TPA: formylglycine-generating enzyme family protein [Hyphomicrobiaceae bacterium]|nr:formylglycine-generating enzyme family protein [Hyphomicrobiaceae bacterium]